MANGHLFVTYLVLLAPSRKRLLGVCGLTLVIELLILPQPFIFAYLIDNAGQISDDEIIFTLIIAAIILLFVEVGYGLSGLLRVRLNRSLALDAANRLRQRYLAHLLDLPYPYFLERGAGGMADTALNDADDIDRVLADIVERGLRNVAIVLVVLITLLIWNPLIALVGGIFTPLAVLTQRRLRKRVMMRSRIRPTAVNPWSANSAKPLPPLVY